MSPEPVNRAGKLHQLGTAQTPDRGRALEVEPAQRRLNRVRANTDLVHCLRQRRRHWFMRVQMLVRAQYLEQTFEVGLKQAVESLAIHGPRSLVGR